MAFQRKIQGEAALKTIFVDDRPTAKRLRKSKLVVLEGPEQGQELTIAKEEVLVGRSSICDLTLTDSSVSSRHFKIIAADRGYLLQDLGSTNGTFYGDIKLKEIYLRPGTVFRAGNTVLKFKPTDEVVTIALSDKDKFDQVIGASIPMRAIFAHLERVAPSELTVLIEGETGTGKELVAQAIHNHSERAKKEMVVLDCSAIPRDLIESTIFGHEKGSFTGAIAHHKGVFEQADGGTIFLDEIGELDINLQPKLLRVLENRELKRVGADRTIKVDVRVIAATNRDLRQMVTEGRFREDLYFRLSVMQFTLPPLSARRADIVLLAEHFVKRVNQRRAKQDKPALKISPEAMSYLKERAWPGNIRELKNAVDRATSLCDGVLITRQDLLFGYHPPQLEPERDEPGAQPHQADGSASANALRFEVEIQTTFKEAKQALLDEFEVLYLKRLMEAHKGNISQSAKIAGLTRYHLRELLKKHAMHARS